MLKPILAKILPAFFMLAALAAAACSGTANLKDEAMQALRGATPPAGTPTENALRKCNAWSGQLSANATANTEGNETVFHNDWKCKWLHTETHLHIAALMNDSNSARWLIANGANVHAKDKYGFTPLHLAAIYNAPETAALLLKNGADVNAKDKDGVTSLDLASYWGNLDFASYWENYEMQSLLKRHGGRCNKQC